MATARFPRFSTSLDHETAAALRAHAVAQRMRPADLIRDAIQNELRVQHAAAQVVAAEMERRGEAARRLRALIEAGPSVAAGRFRVDVARLGQGARPVTAADVLGAHRRRGSPAPGLTPRKDPS